MLGIYPQSEELNRSGRSIFIYGRKQLMKYIPSIQQMRAFQILYELGSVSETAKRMHVTQPAITTLIKDLEDKLGVQLFKRTTRKLERTEEAHEANRYISRVLRDLNELYDNFQNKNSSPIKQINIVSTATVTQTFLAPLLQEFSVLNPDIRLNLEDCSPTEFYSYLNQNDADIAIGASIRNIDGYKISALFEDPLVALGPKDFFATEQDSIAWSSLQTHKLILVKPGYGIRDLINHTFLNLNLLEELNIVQQVTMINTAISLAKAGLGTTIVPLSIAKYFADEDFCYKLLIEPEVSRTISLVYSKSIQVDHYLYDFINFIKTNFKDKI
jgi:LysR family transcriptional regulator, carnitine catabolism transcriptional activator